MGSPEHRLCHGVGEESCSAELVVVVRLPRLLSPLAARRQGCQGEDLGAILGGLQGMGFGVESSEQRVVLEGGVGQKPFRDAGRDQPRPPRVHEGRVRRVVRQRQSCGWFDPDEIG